MQEVLAGRYVLGDELGRGGMARVVEGHDLRLHRTVAVKLLDLGDRSTVDAGVRARFVREARAAASFSHPNAVSVFDAGEADGALYLVMELVDGPSVAALLVRNGPFGIDRSREVVDQVLQALGAAHRAGIVHRDVKPGNVLVTAGGVAKLSDFGIAKRLDDLGDLTLAGHVVGTPSNMAPEQVTGRPATPATDLYATGVLLYQVLVNRPPFDAGSSVATALAHRDAPVPDVRERRPDVPALIAAVINRAMAKDPADRFASADEMRAALGGPPTWGTPVAGSGAIEASDDRTSVATAVLPAPSAAVPRRTWWWLALGVAAAATTAVALLGRSDDNPERAVPTTVLAATAASVEGPATAAPVTTAAAVPVGPAAPSPTPATSAPAPTSPVASIAPSTVDEVIASLDEDPGRFGPHATELQRDLERIGERSGRSLERDVERLRDRLTRWRTDGSIDPEVATLVDTLLADVIAGVDGDEDEGDG